MYDPMEFEGHCIRLYAQIDHIEEVNIHSRRAELSNTPNVEQYNRKMEAQFPHLQPLPPILARPQCTQTANGLDTSLEPIKLYEAWESGDISFVG